MCNCQRIKRMSITLFDIAVFRTGALENMNMTSIHSSVFESMPFKTATVNSKMIRLKPPVRSGNQSAMRKFSRVSASLRLHSD